ncbi:diaminobutyrate acetyltransferase [Isoptericola sp. NPDC057191]|uniref:diaminobutyrate acetyltransferase n=1 Tax=Isoptericola sp. NPDC057191 TaxID=3346041 RepID=UPI003643BEB0
MDTTDTATTNHPTDDCSTDAVPASTRPTADLTGLTVRPPTTADGAAMWRLARDSGSLDLNSSYAYLLLADHFSATCRLAFLGSDGDGDDAGDDGPVGFLAAYRLPADPATLFVWQVAVDPRARGRRVAGRLLDAVVDATGEGGPAVARVHTTVTADNAASRRVFARWAAERGATLRETTGYEAADFPDGHDGEPLLVIEGFRPSR